jgi:hypothetical protein
MDSARRVYQTIVDTVKTKYTGVAGAARNNDLPKFDTVRKATTSSCDKLSDSYARNPLLHRVDPVPLMTESIMCVPLFSVIVCC